MKKLILPIIILSLLFGVMSFAQEIELPSPGLTPDSPFYFLDNLAEKIGMFFTFGVEKKAEKAMRYAEEKLAEVKAMAEQNKVQALERANQRYQEFLGLANTKVKEAKEKGKDVEELVILITENTLKHQEILIEVFEKVPEEAKTAIEKAIEVSRRGSEEAVRAVTGAKKEELQQKIEEVKTKAETADWKTYINEKYGYSFKYPPDCFYGPMPVYCKEKPPEERPSECLCFLDSENPDEIFLQAYAGEKDRLVLATFSVSHYMTHYFNPPLGTDLVSWLKEKFSNLYKDIPDKLNTEIGGTPAVKFYTPRSPQAFSGETIYFIKNDKLFVISILDVDSENNRKLYNKILSTFKFIEIEKVEEEAPKVEEVPQVEEKSIAPSTPALKVPVLTDPGVSVKKHEAFALNWTSIEGAKRYWLQRDTSTNFSIPAWICETNSDTDNPGVGTSAPEVTTTYYYRVKACDDQRCSAWSNVVDMRVIVPSITVISPNGGERWVIGNTYDITWTSPGVDTAAISVCFVSVSGRQCTHLVGVHSGTGIMSWPWPIDPNAPYVPGDNLKIKITAFSDSTIYDESDNYFSIASLSPTCPVPEAPVVSAVPTGPVNSGVEYSISWSIVGGASHYILQRDTDLAFSNPSIIYSGSLLHIKKESHSPSVSTLYWYKARAENSCGVGPWSNIVGIHVEVPTAPVVPIPQAPVLTDPGISVKEHEAFTLNWTSVSGATSYILRRDTNSSFSNPVTVYSGPLNSFSGDLSPSVSTTYYFRVEACNNTGGCSSGSNVVDMQVIVPSITVTFPNGGETLKPGETLRITWNSVGIDDVRITLFCLVQRYDMTKNVPVPAASGYYDAIIPSITSITSIKPNCEGDDYKIGIVDFSNGAIYDYSDSYFSIVVPSVTVISPNGGETWTIGQTKRVSWSSTGVNYVRIYIYDESIAGSGSTNYIYDGAISASTGYYDWTIQKGQLPGSTLGFPRNYKIIVDGVNEATLGSMVIVWDWSDNYFSIAEGAVGLENIRNQLASVSEVISRLMENVKKPMAGPIGILSGSYGIKVLAKEAELPDPGLTPDSPFYFLKTWKESIQVFFTFGEKNKAKQFLHLSEVRLAEYQKMIEKGKTEIAQKTLKKYEEQLNRALEKTRGAKGKGADVEKLAILITEKTLKHQEILVEVFEKVPEEAKTAIQKAIEISRRGSEEAVRAVTGTKKEELQKKIEELKTRVEEVRETVDWNIYNNYTFGYKIKYPDNFFTTTPSPLSGNKNTNFEIVSQVGATIQIGKNPERLSAIDWIEQAPDDISFFIRKYKDAMETIDINEKECARVFSVTQSQGLPMDQWVHTVIPFETRMIVISKVEKDKSYNLERIYQKMLPTFEFVEVETVDWKVYKNKEYGFEVRYPPGWKAGVGALPNNFVFGESGWTNTAKVNITVYTESFIDKIYKEEAKERICARVVLLVEEAYRCEGTDFIYLETEHNGKFYLWSAFGTRESEKFKIFNQMLSTFRFIEPEEAEEETPKVEEEKKEEICNVPKAPVLADPGISVTDEVFTIKWTGVEGATKYQVQRDTNSNFSAPLSIPDYWLDYEQNSMTGNPNPEVTTTYYYRIKACNDCGCSPWSNVVDMEVIVPPSITVTSPNGGEEWVEGQTYKIEWQFSGLEKVTIDLFAYSSAGQVIKGFQHFIAKSIDATKGYYNWTIPEIADYPNYKLRIYNKLCIGGDVDLAECLKDRYFDESDNYFSIISSTVLEALSACKKIREISDIDRRQRCIAMVKKDPSGCGILSDPETYCYKDVAMVTRDSAVCEKIKDLGRRESCEALAERIPDKCSVWIYADYCWAEVAALTVDASICNLINYSGGETDCKAVVLKDVSYCENSDSEDCYQMLALLTGDEKVCEGLKERDDLEWARDLDYEVNKCIKMAKREITGCSEVSGTGIDCDMIPVVAKKSSWCAELEVNRDRCYFYTALRIADLLPLELILLRN